MKIDIEEAVMAFSLSLEYLRNGNDSNENYLLGLSKYYVGLLIAMTICLCLGIGLCLVFSLLPSGIIDIHLGALIMGGGILTVVGNLFLCNRIALGQDEYEVILPQYKALEKSQKNKLIWKYNLIFLILLLTHQAPLYILYKIL